ncbi:stalk domain-containing protein [Paenibacillus apiarius]|uniref:stalk domain-containing protein n=1 Tax=Paenibacillus apiarius TaxID=46240 RepID=UPI003B3AACC1
MKKWTYLTSGVVIGALVATAGSAFADQVKTLIGKQVTAEYDVVVNGKTLQDKGAAIDGRTNVPIRSIANAIGADIKVEGKKILVTLEQESKTSAGGSTKPTTSGNKYMGNTRDSLLTVKDSIENKILKPTIKGREEILAELDQLKKSWEGVEPSPAIVSKEKQLADYNKMIDENNEELRLVNEALTSLEK